MATEDAMDKTLIEEAVQAWSWGSKELRRRYEECDTEGHYSPDTSTNCCHHCYRTLEIGVCPSVKERNKREERLPEEKKHLTLVINQQEQRDYHDSIILRDFVNGSGKIAKQVIVELQNRR